MDTDHHAELELAQTSIITPSARPDNWRTALDVCIAHGGLDILSIHRLCTSSWQLKKQILTQLAAASCTMARKLLVLTLKQASAAAQQKDLAKSLGQLEGAVGWLIAEVNIPQQLIVQDTPQYIRIPRVSYRIASIW